jgi:hypothetical protein
VSLPVFVFVLSGIMLERSCAVQGIDRANKLLALHTMEEECIRGEWRRKRETK